LLGGHAFASAWKSSPAPRIIAIVLAVLYCGGNCAEIRVKRSAPRQPPLRNLDLYLISEQGAHRLLACGDAIENGFRWMGRTATVRLAGPQSKGQRLAISGFGPRLVLASGPLHLYVSVDGAPVGRVLIEDALPGGAFARPDHFASERSPVTRAASERGHYNRGFRSPYCPSKMIFCASASMA
jgi:hypothetical protein